MVEFGTDSFLAVQRRKMFLVGFVVGEMVMVTFFLECTFLPLQQVRDLPEFATLLRRDRSRWPRCLLWHGWLPQLAERRLESALGAYPADLAGCWVPPDFWDEEDIALEMVDHPNIWTDGSRVDYPTGGFEVAGSGVFFRAPEAVQSVQRAEFWGAILALQAYYPCHLGIDNLNVARIIGRLLDRGSLATPLPWVPDGDLVAIVQHMLIARGPGTVRVTKVEGHATEFDVEQGRVRAEDRFGNHEVDAAADLGRRSQSQRDLFTARDLWYPIVGQLHRFMVAIPRVSVNHDVRGGTAPDSLVWDRGGVKKRRNIEVGVNVDLAALPGPPGFLNGPWM